MAAFGSVTGSLRFCAISRVIASIAPASVKSPSSSRFFTSSKPSSPQFGSLKDSSSQCFAAITAWMRPGICVAW